MNKVELSKQLQSMGISPNKYSLEGSVATWDTIVLVENYNIWKVLYIDERGNQNELASFKTENDGVSPKNQLQAYTLKRIIS